FFSFLPLRHPTSTLFPYTTLFRSDHPGAVAPVRRLRARAGAAPSAGENVGGRPVTARTKGLVVAALHIALVSALGAKLLADRAALPRVWVEVAPYDPNLPIRGRYVRLQVKAEARGFDEPARSAASAWGYARLSVEGDRLVATRTDDGVGHPVQIHKENGRLVAALSTPVAYFIPEQIGRASW